MFKRRLNIVLCVLVITSMVLFGRVFGMQVLGHSYWTKQAAGLLTRPLLTETTRGKIYDVKNQLLAEDTACTDACVAYQAITKTPDKEWVNKLAVERVSKQLGSDFKKTARDKRAVLIAAEDAKIRQQIDTMWTLLADRYHPAEAPPEGVDFDAIAAMTDLRQGIVQAVEARRKWIIDHGRARADAKSAASSALVRWIFSDGTGEASSAGDDLVIEEQQQPHVILHALDSDGCNFLGKHLDDFPGLVLRPSTHRLYPQHTVAAHLLGRMSRVSVADLAQNKAMEKEDPRLLLPNDMVGRDGIEALCEPLLRGIRGKIEKQVNDGTVVGETPFQPGADVHLSIDSDLQAKVQEMLKHVEMKVDKKLVTPPGGLSMHSAAVVLDVRTNEVRVLASNPGFDANDLENNYSVLVNDRIEEPLRNRATSDEFEPGSTAKPMIGMGAITDGLVGPHEGIECTGFLLLPVIGPDGKFTTRKMKLNIGRCWVASEYSKELHGEVAHHPIPYPHKGIYGNPDGFLTYSDALERSCNVFFETVADRIGPAEINRWYEKFGIGRLTGIGIYERPGRRPEQFHAAQNDPRMVNCFSGIGQGNIWATPLQIANEAATLARGGIWMRPRLLTAATQEKLDSAHSPSANRPPDWVDIHLDPEALRQAKIGMTNVVTRGTGKMNAPEGITVAAKTGTADGVPFQLLTKDKDGHTIRQPLTPVMRDGEETSTPWYRASDQGKIVNAWYMGYAPADHPADRLLRAGGICRCRRGIGISANCAADP